MRQPPNSLTAAQIAAAVRAVGVVPGDTLLVHSSLSSLSWVEGGATAVVEGLLEAVGAGGTVMFPTFTGHRNLSASNPPVFRPHLDACWTGTIPQTAWQLPGAHRSLGPTHSVAALGRWAAWVTDGHERCTTPCGLRSPFHRLRLLGGKVLFVGVTLSCCTLCHHIEELAGAPYVCVPKPVAAQVILPDGRTIAAPLRIHAYGPARNYPGLEPELLERGLLTLGACGPATLRLLDAAPFCELMIPRVHADPGILLAAPSQT
jgi:aminoglycoside 3-N-acetyltransferase